MSHTSAQSSHNPAPDLGPEQSTEAIIQWMRKVTAKLVQLEAEIKAVGEDHEVHMNAMQKGLYEVEDALEMRLKRLEGANPMPMLLDLSERLEALEEIQAKHNEQLFNTTINNWNNEGGQ